MAKPFTPRITRLVACPEMWHHYVFDRAINTTRLSPAGSQNCRLLHLGGTLVLQRKEFEPFVSSQPGLGMRPLGDLVASDVVFHQPQGEPEREARDLHRTLEQSYGPVQRQLRRFFRRSRRVSVTNK